MTSLLYCSCERGNRLMKVVTVEGRQPVLEALKAGRRIKRIYIAENSKGEIIKEIESHADKKGIKVIRAGKSKIDDFARTQAHQGVVAFAEPFAYAGLQDLLDKAYQAGEAPFILALDQIQDPQNFGSIIRTADAMGVHGIIVPKKRAVQVTPGVEKASAGAVEYVSIAQSNIALALDFFRGHGCMIVGADAEGEIMCFDADFKNPVVLVIGSEGRGMRELVKKKCDILVKIPMRGRISSLNAANAAAVLMYEILRQRL